MIYLPIEVTARELDSRILLSFYLIRKRKTFAILPMRWFMALSKKIPPGPVLLSNCDKIQLESLLIPLSKQGFKIFIMDEEAPFHCDSIMMKRYQETRYAHKNGLSCINKFFISKKQIKNFPIKKLKEKIYEYENPRKLFCSPIGQVYFQDEQKKIKKMVKKYFLFNMHIVENQLFDEKLKSYFRSYLNRKIIKTYNNRDTFVKKMFYEIINMIKLLSKDKAGYKIVFRPHPADKIKKWKLIFKKHENILVSKSFSSLAWAFGAEAVIHSGCTSGREAADSGCPTFAFLPQSKRSFVDQFTLKGSKKFKSIKKLFKALKKLNSIKKTKSINMDIKNLLPVHDLLSDVLSKNTPLSTRDLPNPYFNFEACKIFIKAFASKLFFKINGEYIFKNISLKDYQDSKNKCCSISKKYFLEKIKLFKIESKICIKKYAAGLIIFPK